MNRRVLIGVVSAIAVVGLWFLLLWQPQQAKIGKARTRAQAAEQQASDLGLQVKRLRDLKAGTALKQSQLERLRVAIPDQPNLAEFILDANQAATTAGIDFLSVTPAQPAAGAAGVPASVHLSMTITGGYYQVVEFLNRVDEMSRIVVLDSVSLNSGADATQLSVSLEGRMFITKAPDAAPAASSLVTTPPAGATTTTTVAPATTSTTLGAA